MASDTDILIQKLHKVEDLLRDRKSEQGLTDEDWGNYSIAEHYFGKKYYFKNNYQKFLSDLPISVVRDYINSLQEKGEEKEKPKEQQASIPPELESLVAEYRQNQALLEEDDIKSNSQRSVAEQVKIAIAHAKIRERALANRQKRVAEGQKFQDPDQAFVNLSEPKSVTKTAALAASYRAAQEVAFTHESFQDLSPEIQNQIISEAAELNSISVTNIDVAIQSAALLIDTSKLSPEEKARISNISSSFVHSVYDAVNTQTTQAAALETQIAENEIVLLQLEREAQTLTDNNLEIKLLQIKSLAEKNQHLATKIDNLNNQFKVFIDNQATEYKKFEDDSNGRISQSTVYDIKTKKEIPNDIIDHINTANSRIETLQDNLNKNGVQAHIYTSMDDAARLERAIRKDMPGTLRQSAGYEAEYTAAVVNGPFTQDANIHPAAILLYGKDLTPKLLAQARKFAQDHPESALGKLLKTRKDIFDAADSQIRKIHGSQLGQDISKTVAGGQKVVTGILGSFSQTGFGKGLSKITSGFGKTFKSISSNFGKLADRLGGFGTLIGFATNPWIALQSWAGRQAGRFMLKKITQSIEKSLTQKGLKILFQKTAKTLLENGLKKGIKEVMAKVMAQLAAKVAAKLAVKLSLQAAAQATNAIIPGLGIVIGFIIDALWWIGEKTIGVIRSVSRALWNEDIKARDILIAPLAGVGTLAGTFVGFIGGLTTATAAAATSAIGIIATGIAIGAFFYITSIATAPLISTLVQLDSSPKTASASGCANIQGIFVSQRDPSWASVVCPTCTSADACNIGGSGCGSASTTMILKSFGVDTNVVDVWNTMHNNGAYVYNPNAATHPYTSCPSTAIGNLQILTDAGLTVTGLSNLDEADKTLSSCGLVLALGQLYTDCPDKVNGCGHYLVITGHNGNLITTDDPWSGEGYVHNIDGLNNDTFKISQMWGAVP